MKCFALGQFWDGPSYSRARRHPTHEDLERWQRQAVDSRQCLINLQLMTTDLSRQRPISFPLRPSDSELWIDVDELTRLEIFPVPVLDALQETQPVHFPSGDRSRGVYHRLPYPGDMPVVFPLRISMALPVLFRAVPLYRLEAPVLIEDDIGRTVVADNGSPLTSAHLSGRVENRRKSAPRTDRSAGDEDRRMEKLWLSDGGITSNFPVHLFDTFLPQWQSVGLNLGPHSMYAPHQDVVLPGDFQRRLGVPREAFGNTAEYAQGGFSDGPELERPPPGGDPESPGTYSASPGLAGRRRHATIHAKGNHCFDGPPRRGGRPQAQQSGR